MDVPDFVTHYYMAGRVPFGNLSDLTPDELEVVVEALSRSRTDGEHQRVFGPRYMELRRLTEQKLLESFRRAGGRPARATPHYFVLGRCPWFEALAVDMRTVTLSLGRLPAGQTSFTYPDSMTAMGCGASFGLAVDPQPYHGRVYRLDELERVTGLYGMPDGAADADYGGYAHRPFEKYIEVQLWSDDPVLEYVRDRR